MHSGNVIQFCPSMDGQHGRHGTCLRPVAVTDMQIIEEFVVLMYDRSSSYKEVNEARLDLFARKQ